MTSSRIVMLGYLIVLWLTFAVASFIVCPSVNFDSGWGLIALKSWQEGAPFNNIVEPAPKNIAEDHSRFLTWWSPAQYLIPNYFLNNNQKYGMAIWVTVSLFSLLGLTGYYVLFRQLGFTIQLSLMSCIVIASSRFFSFPFKVYNGGEILLFGVFGWLLCAVLCCFDLRWWHILLLPLILLLGVFFKLSFLICSLAIVLALAILKFLETGPAKDTSSGLKIYILKLASVWAAFYAILYMLFLSKGSTPASGLRFGQPVKSMLLAFASPLLSAFSLGDLLNRIFAHLKWTHMRGLDDSYFLLLIVAAMTLWLLYRICKIRLLRYEVLLFSFFAIYFGTMTALYVKGASVSFEDRHFRPVGILLLPGILAVLAEVNKQWVKISGYTVLVLCCVYGVSSFVLPLRHGQLGVIGRSGLSLLTISPVGLKKLHSLDGSLPAKSAIFYVISPEIALEVKQQRVIVSHANFQTLEELRLTDYHGRVGNLILILPRKFMNEGKAQVILESFRDYSVTGWVTEELDEEVVYIQSLVQARKPDK